MRRTEKAGKARGRPLRGTSSYAQETSGSTYSGEKVEQVWDKKSDLFDFLDKSIPGWDSLEV